MDQLDANDVLGLTKPAKFDPPKIVFSAKEVDLVHWKGDVLAVGVTEKDMAKDKHSKFENSILRKLDAHLECLLAEASAEEDFTGKAGQSIVLRLPGIGSKRIALIGLGRNGSVNAYQSLGDAVAAVAKSAQAIKVAVALASADCLSADVKLTAASAIASGILLGIFEDNRFKSEPKKTLLQSLDIIGLGNGPDVEKKLKYAGDISSGVIYGRVLVNAPANVLTPVILAKEASIIASTYSDVLTAKILDAKQCKELKMGSFLGVGAASAHSSYFIHLCYKPPSGPIKAKLGLVGKTITFDSGGYNLKVGAGSRIELMKNDMGGAAAILGAAKALGEIKPLGVHFIAPACENMISGTGMRPGDIITASDGKTIEVNNTDAEGRLALADALLYTCNLGVEKPSLNRFVHAGFCLSYILFLMPSGVFTPSEELAKEVFEASEASGEKLWRLPLEDSYWESMKSGIADMINTGERDGGAITAALFLKQFVSEKVQWLHMDIAGPVWNNKKSVATGFGVSTLVEWVLKNAS
ncbi:hypothetical protein Sjap_010870 [Stephania japonica]|uniref:Cytosol aminopeptidase domain-containing protein n=1 Tax=Stephania japonica TaxID=461633 RepID=A0AAP0JCF2_9MAGN